MRLQSKPAKGFLAFFNLLPFFSFSTFSMKKILLMSLVLMVTLFQTVLAQSRTVSGRVADQKTGEGLPGVTVLLKGTTNGVSTNSDGAFSLSVPAQGGTLVFSSVGYITQERAIGNESQINIGLAIDNKQLSEVVVTGYGVQDVKDITGSVAEVKSSVISSQPLPSFDQTLTGRVAGVQVTSTGGTLADGTTMRIRGANTISGNAQPLVVIDGVPTSQSTNVNSFNGGNGTRYNPLADVNPNDIETVTVLKDASASAIYGSRAANGVIIITTKRGKAGQSKIGFETWVGYNQPTKYLPLLNGDQFIAIQNEKALNRFGASSPNAVIAADIAGNPARTDWLKVIFQNGFSQNYVGNISGGSDKATFYASIGYTDQNGILVANRLRRGSARANVDLTPKSWLRAGISANISKTLNNGVLTDRYLAGATVAGYNAPPNVPVYNADGSFNLGADGLLGNGANNVTYRANNFYNPLASLKLQRNDNTTQRVLGSAYLEVEPLKGLKLRTQYGIDYLQNFEDQYSSPLVAGLGRLATTNFPNGEQGLVQDNLFNRNISNWTNIASYDHTFGENHSVSVSGGTEYYLTQETSLYTGAGNFADTKFTQILDGLYSGTSYTGGSAQNLGFQSYFARANYSFANKYYAQFAFRADASSAFGADNRRGYFPAGSIGWRISEEDFMKNLNSSGHLNDLKLRGSYGVVGNSAGLPYYASLTLIGGGQYADVNGYSVTQVGNPGLKWERSRKFDAGLDLSMFNNRIGLVFDYFRTNIDDLILAAPVPYTTGIPGGTVNRNIGSMYNQGVELSINTVNVRLENGFTWSSSFNFTNIKNRVTSLVDGNEIIDGVQRAAVDHTIGEYKLVRWNGVDAANGRAKFLALDGTEKEYDYPSKKWYVTATGAETTAVTGSDAVYTGKTGYPTLFGGFDNTFSFKGIELGIFLQYSTGNYIYNSTRAGLMTNSFNNNLTEILDRWTTPGQVTNVPKLFLQDAVSTQASTRWLEKGNFLRGRQISLAYNLPTSLVNNFGMSGLRIYAQVLNAFVLTGYSGSDPEVNSNRNISNIAYGTDSRSVPQSRSYTLGLNVSF